jgi:anthranilate phosphoribosyltransferase
MMENLKPALTRLAARQPLDCDMAEQAIALIIEGKTSAVQTAAFLMGLRARGETKDELLGAARAMRLRMTSLHAPDNAMDIVGTGGDNSGSYNISTAVALTVAACGVPVAKHGNRSVTSQSGAADVLQALGVNLDCDFARLEQSLTETGVCFLMAPRHHPAMKVVAPIRQELGTRTLFNLLGPLTNPAAVRRQRVGVFAKEWLVPFAEVLRDLGSTSAWIVHGEDGMDEITTTGKTFVAELKDGNIRTFEIHPEDAGLFTTRVGELRGGDAATNATALKAVLAGAQNAYRNIVLFNAAAALIVAGKAATLRAGVELARDALDSGRVRSVLDRLVSITSAA